MIKKRKEPQKDSNILCESMITDTENREEKLKQIKQMFSVIPPDYEEIEKMLSAFSFDKKELAEISIYIPMSDLLYRLQELVKMVEPKTKGASVNLQRKLYFFGWC